MRFGTFMAPFHRPARSWEWVATGDVVGTRADGRTQ